MLFLLCACSSIDSIEIPEPSPSSQTPIESEEPIATSTPEPSKPDPESVPKTLEEMSNRIGMRVFQPIKLPDGYALTQIGYDGDNTAALKYTSDAGTLLYTFYPSTSSVPKDSDKKLYLALQLIILRQISVPLCSGAEGAVPIKLYLSQQCHSRNWRLY